MPSFRNIVNAAELSDAIGSGDFSNDTLSKTIKKKNINAAKYIKGYASDSAIEALANSMDINKGLFKQMFGLENKQIDNYDPNNISSAKKEEFWGSGTTQYDGKAIQLQYDDDTNTFKRGLNINTKLGGYGQTDFWYEDPFVPSFELFFDDTSPFFNNNSASGVTNSLKYFMNTIGKSIDSNGYTQRFNLWTEFQKVFFKIFEKGTERNVNRNLKNKAYYITKIAGLNNLNKKMINFGEDKLTITLNEDVSMVALYLSELYRNLVYSYRNQRYMFPENIIRFNLDIKINDMRNYQLPQSSNDSSGNVAVNKGYLENKTIQNIISPKSKIVYTLHDCTFNFFESTNHGDDIEIGGYAGGPTYTPQSLSFEIIYKSVTRSSDFPLIENGVSIDAWEPSLYTSQNVNNPGTKQSYNSALDSIGQASPPVKSYSNNLLGKAAQTVVNQGINYADNLESSLRELRGSAVNGLITQFRDATINKIEPSNVYQPDFNNRASVANAGLQAASGLLNDLENTLRTATNF